MIINRAVLKIGESEYDILRMTYGFKRRVDGKGRPATVVRGGDIFVQIESEEDCSLLRKMLHKKVPPVKGSIEVLTDEDGRVLRRVEFEQAYVFLYGEESWFGTWHPLMTTIGISPVRLDIGQGVHLDRRWPETSGSYWHEYKPEEAPRGKTVSPKVEDSTAVLRRVYFKDGQGNEITEVPENGVVTICAEVDYAKAGEEVWFTLAYSDGTEKSVAGKVDSSGLVEIRDYQLD